MTKHASFILFVRFVQDNYRAYCFSASVLFNAGADSGKPVCSADPCGPLSRYMFEERSDDEVWKDVHSVRSPPDPNE